MPTRSSFDYAVLRVVPRVERGEFINAGVILFCPELRFLAAQIRFDENRLHALWPEIDLALISAHLEGFNRVCEGNPDAGPIARLSQRERFHWLVAPRSTILQVSPVHSGLCEDPQSTLNQLFRQLV